MRPRNIEMEWHVFTMPFNDCVLRMSGSHHGYRDTESSQVEPEKNRNNAFKPAAILDFRHRL